MRKSGGVPEVSVVIPVYNRARTLARAIDSVSAQTHQSLEMIVVDDGSDDDPAAVIANVGDSRIRYIRHRENRGGAAARNTGIAAAEAPFVAFLDSDDEWLPDKLERQLKVFREGDARLGVVYTRVWVDDGNRRYLGRRPTKRGYIYGDELLGDYVTQTSTWIVRARCFREAGTFDENLPSRQDYDMSLRISRLFHYDFVVEPMAVLHVGSDDRITSNPRRRIEGSLQVLSKIRADIEHLPWCAQRRIISRHLYAIACFCLKSGDADLARDYLHQAISVYPLVAKYWLVLLSLAQGVEAYRRATKITSRVKEFLGVEIRP